MNDALTLAIQAASGQAIVLFAVFLRTGAMVAMLPAFGENSVPMRVKVAAALAITCAVAPTIGDRSALDPDSAAGFGRIILTEAGSGLLLGFMLRLAVFALATAGAIIAQSLSLAQMFGAGPAAEPLPVFSHLLVGAGLALAALLNLHVAVVGYVLGSYAIIPAGLGIAGDIALDEAVRGISASLATAFTLAAPFLIAALVYNLAIGVINRAMPQLMLTFIGAPVITLAGLLLLAIVVPVGLAHWAGDYAALVTGGGRP